jgi:hypothetical protein
MDVMSLPPKMAEHYAKLARDGKAREYIGNGTIALFDSPGQPNREICLVSFKEGGPACGHIAKKKNK